jgi:hypothetical protein
VHRKNFFATILRAFPVHESELWIGTTGNNARSLLLPAKQMTGTGKITNILCNPERDQRAGLRAGNIPRNHREGGCPRSDSWESLTSLQASSGLHPAASLQSSFWLGSGPSSTWDSLPFPSSFISKVLMNLLISFLASMAIEE